MQKPFLFLVIFLFAFMAGCSGNAANNSNTPEPTPNTPISEYTDANQALADGIKLLDIGDTEKAIEVLNRAVELNPDLAEAYFRLGIAYSLIEFRDQAAADESVEPTPTPSPGEKKPKEKKTNSEIAFEKAVEAYKKIIDSNGEDHAAYYNLGRAYNKLNEDEDAAKALRQAVKLNPEDTEYQTELGSILIKLAKYPEAVGALKKALELDPQNLEAEELLEKAEAGRKRITFTQLPDDKKSSNSNTASNSNSAPETPDKDDTPAASNTKTSRPAASPAPTKKP
ncbi:MAG: tetratricopeptide repeat protein [Pyrinomonadaceae bacterium]|nr:tetratricopeptide repeat protein [Pyrinomonadaceae bacterium]